MRVGLLTAVATAIAIGAIVATGGGGGGGSSFTPTFFVAQSAAGSGTGSSCANAKAVTAFNTAANWGAGKSIAPGGGVGLCGTITTSLTVQADGTSGNPITVQFEVGSKISMPVCNPCINMDNRSFIVVDGNNLAGAVESNANGTLLANQARSTGISASPCTSCEIKGLTIGPIYTIVAGDTHICTNGCAPTDEQSQKCIDFRGNNWLIHDNVMHDVAWCLYESTNGAATGDSNTRIYNNEIYNFDHGWAITGASPWGHLYFYGNHEHDMGLWDACDNGSNCHHDGIHCFFGAGTGAVFQTSYIYNNVFDGTVGTNATAWIYLESNPTSPCSSSPTLWYVFNNKFSSTDHVPTNGYFGTTGDGVDSHVDVYNNTFSGPGAHATGNPTNCTEAWDIFENNAVGGCDHFNGAAKTTTDFNAYAAQPTSGTDVQCWPSTNCNFATWQATGKDTHSVFNSAGAVGSNVTGVGTNLTSLCVGDLVPLCSTRLGVARPSVGAWNAGADN